MRILHTSDWHLGRSFHGLSLHDISEKFAIDNGASIPPNLIAIPNTDSNGTYIRYCKEKGLKVHPARFPSALPEYFIRMVTDPGDTVLDPFGGSCITGEVAERLGRKWVCTDRVEEYLQGALGRFIRPTEPPKSSKVKLRDDDVYYRIPHPGLLWDGGDERKSSPLPMDGGRTRSGGTMDAHKVENAEAEDEPIIIVAAE